MIKWIRDRHKAKTTTTAVERVQTASQRVETALQGESASIIVATLAYVLADLLAHTTAPPVEPAEPIWFNPTMAQRNLIWLLDSIGAQAIHRAELRNVEQN